MKPAFFVCILIDLTLFLIIKFHPNLKKLLKITFTLIITIIFFLGFAVPLNQVGNWYQQFMPDLGGRYIADITFVDSLVGYAVTRSDSLNSNFILKTIDGGKNWGFKQTYINSNLRNIVFLNRDTGYVCGSDISSMGSLLVQTTNGGLNWTRFTTPQGVIFCMHVLNTDTIWISDQLFSGRLFITTNGGASWQLQYTNNSNIEKIYMYNSNMGFLCTYFSLFKTTNSGFNWIQISGEGGFFDIFFEDSQTGWKSGGYMNSNDSNISITTNGGINWSRQRLPRGGSLFSEISRFTNINKDTIWGNGGFIIMPNNEFRGIIYRTTNKGQSWYYQIPDTSINIGFYTFCNFVNKNIGWCYSSRTGIHTTSGGDQIWLIGITQISNEIPKDFMLFQNYPNPFNPKTNIKYTVKGETSNVKLVVFDITGKEITNLVNQEQSAGIYEVDFSGSGYASGVYFYKLTVSSGIEVFTDTKTMILVK